MQHFRSNSTSKSRQGIIRYIFTKENENSTQPGIFPPLQPEIPFHRPPHLDGMISIPNFLIKTIPTRIKNMPQRYVIFTGV
jgi:hypothetical protein